MRLWSCFRSSSTSVCLSLLGSCGVVLPLGAQPWPVDTIRWTGSSSDRIDLVVFGDGYQAHEMSKYREDVLKVVSHFFSETPFLEYVDYFNIVAIEVPSNVSGAARDPNALIDNYFGTTYNFADIDRLLVATRSSRAQDILFDQYPLFDQAVLIANDDKYGGSGGWLATTSTNTHAPEIALHEIGHSFANLADEYWAGQQFAAERPNMTKERDRTLNRWSQWLGFSQVDIYPHAENTTWFRPHQNCKMRVLNPPFCPVCREAIAKRIISLVNPVMAWAPVETSLQLTDDTIQFALTLLTPQPNTLRAEWWLDGELIEASSSSLALEAAGVTPGIHQLEVHISDTTALIRDDDPTSPHNLGNLSVLQWTIERDQTTALPAGAKAISVSMHPNPVIDRLQIELPSAAEDGRWTAILADLQGRTLKSWRLHQGTHQVSTADLPTGAYLITIRSGRQSKTHQVVKH